MPLALLIARTIPVTPGMVQFGARVHDYVETHRRLAAGSEQPLCSAPEELARQAEEQVAAGATRCSIRMSKP